MFRKTGFVVIAMGSVNKDSSILPDPFCRSAWWWPAGLEPVPDQYADFCCDFEWPALDPGEALISVTCGAWFTVWMNGIWLHHGPLREVAPWQYYDTLDLREHLVAGRNRLRIRAYHCGVSHQSHEACLAGLLVGGGIPDIGLDFAEAINWAAARSPGFLPGAARLHPCQGFGEHANLTEDPEAWLFRDAKGEPPAVIAPHPLPGREKLLPRDLPPFCGHTFIATRRNIADEWQVWSFEGEVFGFLTVEVEAAAARTCELLHGESLTAEGLPDYGFGGGDFREILELPAGRRCWTSFEKRAVCHLALPADCRVHAVSVREYQRPLVEIWRGALEAMAPETGPVANETRSVFRYEEVEERDAAILEAAARTVAICCDDLLNDCPRRERAQYSDPAVYMEAFPLLFGTWEPIRRWLRQYLRGAGPDGMLKMCYPSPPGMAVIPDFSLAFAGNALRYFEATGDLETLRECRLSALTGVTAFDQFADADGLLRDVPGWVFLCNSFELAKQPRSAALNALWADAWRNLGHIARHLGEPDPFSQRADAVRSAWRTAFFREGRILDADSSPEHDRLSCWNYHFEADRGRFAGPQENPGAFVLGVRWQGSPSRLSVSANGRVRVWHEGRILLDEAPDTPWTKPPIFHAWTIKLPPGFQDGELLVEAAWNNIDWEVFLAADAGQPGPGRLMEVPASAAFSDRRPEWESTRTVEFRPWQAPRFNQITAGYAIASGMLDHDEARGVLTSCLRTEYHVPWLKRTTPLIATPTSDAQLIAGRATLCNTPQSLAFFCRALSKHGMQEAARDLCRRLYGAMIDAGSKTLWEEFAPRSSLCHAWGAMCVPYLLPADRL